MRKGFFILTPTFFVATVVLTCLYAEFGRSWLLSAAITAGTVFYHLAMRLAVGYSVKALMRGKADHTRAWFRQKKFEEKFFKLIRVRKWKKYVPTFSPESFDLKQKTLEELLGEICQSEIVHELIMVFSFLPVAAVAWFGEPIVFVATSLAAAMLDFTFVIVQRYNRPGVIRLIESQKRRSARKQVRSHDIR